MTQIRSVLDLEAVCDLARVSGEQDRLRATAATLLADPEPVNRHRAMALLNQVDQIQAEIRAAVKRVKT